MNWTTFHVTMTACYVANLSLSLYTADWSLAIWTVSAALTFYFWRMTAKDLDDYLSEPMRIKIIVRHGDMARVEYSDGRVDEVPMVDAN